MDCPTCGRSVPDATTTCVHCGAPMAKAGEGGAPSPAPPLGGGATAAPVVSSAAAHRLVERVKAILLTPKTEWPAIAAEATSAQDIYLGYVAPLVAIGIVASFIGHVLVGVPIPMMGTVRLGVGSALAAAIVHFVLTFVAVFVVALIVDALAPTFGGRKDPLSALKVTAYSFTPGWVAAVLTILPVLGSIAALIGLYGLYLMYLGLPVLMGAPRDKSLGYTVVVVLCAVVLSFVVSALTTLVTGGYGA